MKKCFIYHRVSSEQQRSGTGIERQEQNLNAYVERTNLLSEMDDPEAIIISDQGVSAFKGLNMSEGELGRWMEQVRGGMWDDSHLVLESIDRFSRQNPFTVVAYLSELVNHNITIHDVSLNMLINRSNSAMLPLVTMSAQRAYEESKLKSDRIRDGWKRRRDQAFKQGTIVTNKRPQWIDVVDDRYVLNEKVAVVREIFRLYQTGIGTPTIAKMLNERGSEWLFESSRLWRGESIHKLLRNKRVTGSIFISEIIRDYNSTFNPVDQKLSEMDVYPIAISKEEFDLVQELLKSRRSGVKVTGGKFLKKFYDPDTNKPYLDRDGNVIELEVDTGKEITQSNIFNGIFRCARCGEAMYHNVVVTKRDSKKRGKFTEEYRYIRCIAERDALCENKALQYEVVEKFVIEHIKNLDFTKILRPNENNPEIELVRLKIEEEEAHIEEYKQNIERYRNSGKKIPFAVWGELEESEDRLKELKVRQSTFTEVQVDTDYLRTVDPSVLFDVKNIEVRSRMAAELSKILDGIQLYRTGKHYVITINYKKVEVLKHVLFVEAKKVPELVSCVAIERFGDTVAYSTPSFCIAVEGGTSPHLINVEGEPLSIIDWSLLLNYVDAVDPNDDVGIWMRDNMNFVFTN
ncbi:recombinase family protein [Mangrovibacter plantisponsor]|uniref:DNA invertase Pin-like site-specific DNA recombinase n=1 Tax=Mangrovibacter plantisponsor TaxID=451513 RepID=A0A317PUI5_9ENTR|nr:recombinase family protein [Mangrovibacter plantisponsor]PWW04960.1 DNA invertase Pin-like site-specific DNA recombinase [Mangrovibacter plantisponsor]